MNILATTLCIFIMTAPVNPPAPQAEALTLAIAPPPAYNEHLERFEGLCGLTPALYEASETYDIDPILVMAIIRLESGNGESRLAKDKNNLAGIKKSDEYAAFPSKEACVWELCRLLARYRDKRGLCTVEEIATRYCPGTEEWPRMIRDLMQEAERRA